MSLLLHIVAKDLRRLRWQLSFWLGLLVTKYAIGFTLIWGGSFSLDTFRRLELITVAMSIGEVALVFLLTALLVQGDRVGGTQQFWLTRPISGGRMLGAKVLGALLLLIVPAFALALPWWLACGFGLPWIAAATVDLLSWHLLAIFPAFLVASLTDNLGRFIVWSVILAWLTAMAPLYAQMAWTRASGAAESGMGFGEEQVLVAGVVLAMVMIGVVALQYQVRRWQRSVPVLAAGALLALGSGTVWVGEGTAARARAGAEPWNAGKAADLKLEWKEVRVDKSTKPTFEHGALIKGYLMATNIPDGLALYGKSGEFTWQMPGGFEYRRGGRVDSMVAWRQAIHAIYRLPAPRPDAETEEWIRANPLTTVRGTPLPRIEEPKGNVAAVTRLPLSLVGRTQRQPARLELTANLELRQPVVGAATPMQQGRWTAGRGMGLRVMDIEPVHVRPGRYESGRVSELRTVTTVQSVPNFLVQPANWLFRRLTGSEVRRWYWWAREHCVVLHPRYGLGVVNYRKASQQVQIASVSLQSVIFDGGIYSLRRDGQWKRPQEDWFDGAEIVLLDWMPVARLARQVTSENVVLEP